MAFRAGWGASRSQARQFVRHGHVLVNGKRVTIPSYRVRQGDSRGPQAVVPRELPRAPQHGHPGPPLPGLARDRRRTGFEVGCSRLPLREHIDEPVQEQLIVELYSK